MRLLCRNFGCALGIAWHVNGRQSKSINKMDSMDSLGIRLELSAYKMLQKKVSRNWVYIALSLSLSPSLSSIPTVALPAIQHSRGRCRSRPAAFFSSILPPFLSNVINIIYYFRVRPAQRRIRVYFFHPALPCPALRSDRTIQVYSPTQPNQVMKNVPPFRLILGVGIWLSTSVE
jgi:hypothetical protein